MILEGDSVDPDSESAPTIVAFVHLEAGDGKAFCIPFTATGDEGGSGSIRYLTLLQQPSYWLAIPTLST